MLLTFEKCGIYTYQDQLWH